MKTIKISTEYSDTPLGRFDEDGDFNGSKFREQFLKPALMAHDCVKIDLDDVEGFGSSFLEEAFGGLVRKGYFTSTQLHDKLQIVYLDEFCKIYEKLIWRHIDDAVCEEGA